MNVLRTLLACLLLTLGPTSTFAQKSEPQSVIMTVIPELLSVRTLNSPTTFDINITNYPPVTYPAIYTSGKRQVDVHSSVTGAWDLQIEVRDLTDAVGTVMISASQISFRVNSGPWIRATGLPQVIHSQVGPTGEWLPLTLEFALELKGRERAGAYAAITVFSAHVLP